VKQVRYWHSAALLGLGLAVGSCKSDDPSAPLFRGTTVSILDVPADGVVLQDGTLQLRAVVKDGTGADVRDVAVTWSSSDRRMATVSDQGLVTGVALGAVVVRAAAGGATDDRELSVRIGVPAPASRDADPVTTTLLDGLLRITVPSRALPSGAVLHLRPATGMPRSDELVAGTAVELGPEALRFEQSVTIAFSWEGVPAGQRSRLRIHRVDDGEWEPVSSIVDPFDQRVRASITRAGIYALLLRPPASSLVASAGDGQQASAGSSVPVAPRVTARDAAAAPVEGAVVRFSVISGGGSIVGADSGVSDGQGMAALLGQWRLGPTAGANALRAAVDGAAAPAVTFNATATSTILPAILFSQDEVIFDGTVGLNPAPRNVTVASSTSIPILALSIGPVQYTPAGVAGWLQATLDRSTTPAVLRLAPASSSLPPSDYVARVPVRSAMPGVAPETVTVRLAVRHGATSAIIVTQQLSGAVSGNVATGQPRLEFRTAAGTISPVSEQVTAALMSGGGTLRGTMTVLAVNGVATFTDLRVDGFGPHRLRFTGGGVSVDGGSFTISQVLASISIDPHSTDVEEDRNFLVPLQVRLRDEAGLDYMAPKMVTASKESGPGQLEGNTAVNSAAGIAKFTNLHIDDGLGVHTIRFRTTSPALTVVTGPITVRPR
jgi:hypothetical protein